MKRRSRILTSLALLAIVWVFPTYAVTHIVNVFPKLSLKTQQIHTQKRIEKSLWSMKNPQLLTAVEGQIRKTVAVTELKLLNAVKKVYVLSNFSPLWLDKKMEQTFLEDYAVFAVSGISRNATRILNKITHSAIGSMERDIFLTDAFLDYFYYNKNLKNNINTWLYQSNTYNTKAVSDQELLMWVEAVKSDYGDKFIAKYIPSENNVYTETVKKVLTGSADNISLAKLALNAQRLRVIPNFNNGLYVNIPSYQLYYYKNGQLALHSVVVVGRKKRQTPILFSKLSDVVVNPPWTIPPTILEEDVIPKYSKDPNYGAKKGFQVLDYRGNTIAPESIDWAQYKGDAAKNFPYMIRQKPGKRAALGRYKFNMPSAEAIFLHDTPYKGVFSRKKRALSSGCIRVKKAAALSQILLSEAGWSVAKQKATYNSEQTTFVKIRSDNPVYLYYVTAWVENGQVHTLPDVYRLDPAFSSNSVDWSVFNKSF
ncbi:L,D-transpeptidase family protein [Pasteurella skyensis]|uniref:L,D-transpeptidase family protein n=1 Tax=Phocoenobacter skyensis TaxID=97481 RepID=UPI002764AE4F|nr:L,D-transpeptidase family protein [Pasteurella skyensis]MDP8177768.1 L,D-transpeptidase family protein [Pasteurella skyensis]MDP8200345.1 L,D-transpeptidase family protein [Pasteurella skyensis]